MDFLEFRSELRNRQKWELKEVSDYWLNLKSGVQKRVGFKSLYRKIGQPEVIVLELNPFWREAVALMLFTRASRPRPEYCWILKDGKWLAGLKDEALKMKEWKKDGKFCGIVLELKVKENEVVKLEIPKAV